jgi:hypothetical protein
MKTLAGKSKRSRISEISKIMETKLQGDSDREGKIKKHCFVIMPFSQTNEKKNHTKEYWDWFFEGFLQPVLEPHYKVSRSQATTANLTRDIMLDIVLADLVVAVLTDNNPNVLWELGVRHFSRNGTILLIEKGSKREFDLCVHGSLEYEDFRPDKFHDEIKPYLESAKQEVSDSPVSDFLNIGPNFCMHYAAANLQRAKMFIADHLNEAKDHNEFKVRLKSTLEEFQNDLNPKYNAQITIVDLENANPKIWFHREQGEIGKNPSDPNNLFWKNFYRPDKSYFDAMLVICRGIRLGYVYSYEERLTALAFDTLMKPKWLIVSEAHDPRHLRPMLKQ